MMQSSSDDEPTVRSVLPIRWLKAFGRFWWDFLVGDTPEIFIGVLVLLVVTDLLIKRVGTPLVWVVMPPLVVCIIISSVLRGRDTG